MSEQLNFKTQQELVTHFQETYGDKGYYAKEEFVTEQAEKYNLSKSEIREILSMPAPHPNTETRYPTDLEHILDNMRIR